MDADIPGLFEKNHPRFPRSLALIEVEVSARDFDHLLCEGAGRVEFGCGFDVAEQVGDLVMLETHDGERSALRAEVRFERGEEQLVFDPCMGFESETERGNPVLEVGEGTSEGSACSMCPSMRWNTPCSPRSASVMNMGFCVLCVL